MDDWKQYIQTITPIKPPNRYIDPIKSVRITINRNVFEKNKNTNIINNSINLSRKKKRKFKSEVKLDLHGIKPELLDEELTSFCTKAILYNFQFATIITGKGRGITKKYVLDWIINSNFVNYYFEIKDSQKGCGAIGIKLRNNM